MFDKIKALWVSCEDRNDHDLNFLIRGNNFHESLVSETCLGLPCDPFDINVVYKITRSVLVNNETGYIAFKEALDAWIIRRTIDLKKEFELWNREAEYIGVLEHYDQLQQFGEFQPECVEYFADSDVIDDVYMDGAANLLLWGIRNIFEEIEMRATPIKKYFNKVNSIRILCTNQRIKRIYHHLVLTVLRFLGDIAVHGDIDTARDTLMKAGLEPTTESIFRQEFSSTFATTYFNLLIPCTHDVQTEYARLLPVLNLEQLGCETDLNFSLLRIQCTRLDDWLDVSDSVHCLTKSPIPYLQIVTSKGFKKNVKTTVGIVIALLVMALVALSGWALTKHETLQSYNIDPTSLISLFIVVEGLLLAAFVALYAENWSWHDMIRGQLYVMDFEELGNQSKAINKAWLIRHVVDHAKQYEHIVSPDYLCYIDYSFKGKVVMPHGLTVYELKDAGYSVMRTSHGFYVRVTGSDEHRSATRLATDKNILHVNGTEELRGAPLINYENLLVAGTMNAKHTRGHIAINMEPNRVQLPIFCKDFHRVH